MKFVVGARWNETRRAVRSVTSAGCSEKDIAQRDLEDFYNKISFRHDLACHRAVNRS